jgi:RNA polymerase sigma-70 factor (ECF subfamily)
MDELIPTRTTLLNRVKDLQDQSSWQQFYDTYWKLIHGVAVKSGLTEPEAQDVVQETMLSAAKYLPDFKYDRKTGSFKIWLLNMTRWRIVDHLRKRGPQASQPLPSEETVTETLTCNKVPDHANPDLDEKTPELDALWDAEWENNLFDAAITKVKRRLDPQKYQIFDFYVNKQWDADKVAKTFSISVEQVYLAKHRVTEMIKEEVERLKWEAI